MAAFPCGHRRSNRIFISYRRDNALIPSTAYKAVSVGAYDARYNQVAAFSGRGFTRETNQVKPDICAPGVDIESCAPGGGYTVRSGTSMATPFVTGTAALFYAVGEL